jgi:iron complex outermembrane recepter protein
MSARSQALRTFIALWIALALWPLQRAHAGEKMYFNIPAGPANQTLYQYTDSTQLQVLWPSEDAVGIFTNELKGEFDVVEALARMTRDTRLRPNWIDDESVTLSVVPLGAASNRVSGTYPSTAEQLSDDRRSLLAGLETVKVVAARSGRTSIVQSASQLLAFNRTDIDAFSFATTQDLLRTLPQVFGGGPSEDTRRIGFEAPTNFGIGAGVNLRGLGAGSTLTLLNGRRMAVSGSEGVFTDISNVPLALIERIEILPDSSSSMYGADAVGGVVNFVLMDSFDGAQTDATFGAATRGHLDQHRVSQVIGINSRAFNGLAAFDFHSRDALPSADRRLARSDLRMFGGDNFDTINTNPGTIIVGSRTWAIAPGHDGTQLDSSKVIPDQQYQANQQQNVDLLPSQQRWSLYATGKKDVTDKISVFSDALFSQRDVRGINGGVAFTLLVPRSNAFYFNPGNPLLPVQVAYNFADDLGFRTTEANVRTLNLVAGVDSQWGDRWRVTTTGNFTSEHGRSTSENGVNPRELNRALADSNPQTAFNPFGDGSHTNPATLERIRDTALLTTSSHTWSGNITASRELDGLPGGQGKLATGVDYRRQSFAASAMSATQNLDSEMGRTVKAAFATLSLPILGKRSDLPGPSLLELSLAGRYEDYSDFGGIVTPRYGLSWAPLAGMVFRGTWSRSFRPPSLLDLDESDNIVAPFLIIDPSAPGGRALMLLKVGRNAELREEHAKSWTLGLDVDVPTVPGLSAAFTYFNTTFTDRMNRPVPTATLLTDPTLADLITLNPTLEQRQAVCSSAPYQGPGTCMTLPIVGLADLRVRNSQIMKTSGIDVLGQYVRHAERSTLTFRVDGTYLVSFSEAQTPDSIRSERVSTQNYPIDLRLRGSLDWQRGPFRTGAFVNYFDDYRDIASIPQRRVSSWTTFDLALSYSLGPGSGTPFAGTTFSLSAENVLDREPPFLNNSIGIGYDQENGELTGRILSFSVRRNW